MTAAYPAAAIPEPFQILGLRLKPFCIGHYLLMERFEISFVSPEPANATKEDLIMGVLICSMSYEDFLAFLYEPDFEEQIIDWGKLCGEFDVVAKMKLFNDYIVKSAEQPVVIYEDEGKPSGAHWCQALKLVLTGQLGYTASEALNLPLSQAFHEFWKNAEREGQVSIARPDEVEAMKAAEVPHG